MCSFSFGLSGNYQSTFMMSELYDRSYTTFPNVYSPEVEQDAWGRLYKKRAIFHPVVQKTLFSGMNNDFFDIYGPQLSVGRDPTCQFVIAKDSGMELKWWNRISKLQFILYKDMNSEDKHVFIKDMSRNGTFLNNELIGKNQVRMVKDGDVISIIESIIKVFTFKDLTPRKPVCVPKEAEDKFFIGQKLGSGTFGVVYKVFDRKVNPFALKYVKTNIMSSRPNQMVSDNEISIMKIINHVCIIKTIDVMMCDVGACLVLEYMTGGDLLTRIIETPDRRLTEEQSRCFFYQITEAVHYLHKKGITHRDIKPDNVLLMGHEEFTLVKLTDFGLSKLVVEGTFMKSLLGTPTYTAPEILLPDTVSYTSKVDIWSMGVMLFAMLSGTLPFAVEYGDIHEQVTRGRYQFLAKCWKDVSQSALRLIKRMLIVSPETRIDAKSIFEASWMNGRHIGVINGQQIMELNGGHVTRIQSGLERIQLEHEFAVPLPPKKRARLE